MDNNKNNYLAPYEEGNWESFKSNFSDLIMKDFYSLYNSLSIHGLELIPAGHPLEEKFRKHTNQEPSLFMDKSGQINVFESFLINKELNSYELTTAIVSEMTQVALNMNTAVEKGNQESVISKIVDHSMINAFISKKFPEEEFKSFFNKMYNDEELPEAFMRPDSKIDDPVAEEYYEELYSDEGITFNNLSMAVRKYMPEPPPDGGDGDENSEGGSGSGPNFPGGGGFDPDGNDGDGDDSDGQSNSQDGPTDEQNEAVSSVMEEMANNDDGEEGSQNTANPGGREAGTGQQLIQSRIDEFKKTNKDFYDELIYIPTPADFGQTMEKDFLRIAGDQIQRKPWPYFGDRRYPLYKILGIPQVFYNHPVREEVITATAYIDVSGSTSAYHKAFLSAIKHNFEHFEKIFVFSDYVCECSAEDVENGTYKSSYGTSDCWLKHMMDNDIENAVVFTDGYFHVNEQNHSRLDSRRNRLMFVYMKEYTKKYLEEIEDCIVKEFLIDPEANFEILSDKI